MHGYNTAEPQIYYPQVYIDNIHSKIEKLYVLNVVELIPSMWDDCYITSVSLTVPGKIILVILNYCGYCNPYFM